MDAGNRCVVQLVPGDLNRKVLDHLSDINMVLTCLLYTSDRGLYYRIPADNRDLNYNKYFVEGETNISEFDDYTSHHAKCLFLVCVKRLLIELDYILEQMNDYGNEHRLYNAGVAQHYTVY